MVIDKIENLEKYKNVYNGIENLTNFMEREGLDTLAEKITKNGITLIPIKSKEISSSFNIEVLEAHIKLMDIHITLEGTDVIAYADLDTESNIFKDYDEAGDYLLAKSHYIKTIEVPKGYFCIIPNNFAHMALYKGHSQVKKVVIKMPVD